MTTPNSSPPRFINDQYKLHVKSQFNLPEESPEMLTTSKKHMSLWLWSLLFQVFPFIFGIINELLNADVPLHSPQFHHLLRIPNIAQIRTPDKDSLNFLTRSCMIWLGPLLLLYCHFLSLDSTLSFFQVFKYCFLSGFLPFVIDVFSAWNTC